MSYSLSMYSLETAVHVSPGVQINLVANRCHMVEMYL